MTALARLVLTLGALLLAALPLRAESATLVQDLPIPDFTSLDATLTIPGGDVAVALGLAYDEKGKLVHDGVAQVDGIDVEVKGKVKLQKKTGQSEYKLKAFNKDAGLTVVLAGVLVAGDQPVEGSYKGPKGKFKFDEEGGHEATLGASVTTPQLVIQLDLDEDPPGTTAVSTKGVVTGTPLLTSPYDNLPAEAAELKAKRKRTTFTFAVKQGSTKVSFKGQWDGNGYVGRLSYKLPPAKGKVDDFIVPDIVRPDIQLGKSDKVFRTIYLSGDPAPGTTESFSFFGNQPTSPDLYVTPKGEVVFSGFVVAIPPVTGLWTGTPGSPMELLFASGTVMPAPEGGGVALSSFVVREFSPVGDPVLQGFYGILEQGMWHVERKSGALRHIASPLPGSNLTIATQPDTLVRGDVLTAVNEKGNVAFHAITADGGDGTVRTINKKDKVGIFATDGDPLPAGPDQGLALTLAPYVDITPGGTVVFPVTAPSAGLWTGAANQSGSYGYEPLALAGEAGPILKAPDEGCEAPCVDDDYLWADVDDQVSAGGTGKDDVIAFKARYSGPGVTDLNDEGLWVVHPAHESAHPLPVLFEGETFPAETGLPQVAGDFDPLFVTEAGDVVFTVHEDEIPADPDEPLLLCHYDGRNVSLLGKDVEEDRLVVLTYGFGGYPGVLFRTDSGLASDEPVLWSGKRRNADNELERVIGFGDEWTVEEGDVRTVNDFLVGNVNDDGQFLMVLRFSNATEALVFVEGNLLSTLED